MTSADDPARTYGTGYGCGTADGFGRAVGRGGGVVDGDAWATGDGAGYGIDTPGWTASESRGKACPGEGAGYGAYCDGWPVDRRYTSPIQK